MLFGQLGLGRADAPSYRDKEAPRGQQDRSKTTWKDTVYMIVNTVMRSISLHLKTPKDANRHV